jgi:hypothetical protein
VEAQEKVWEVDIQQPYSTGVISDIIAAQWFQSSCSDGMKFKEYFCDMPVPLIALVCTVVSKVSMLCSALTL